MHKEDRKELLNRMAQHYSKPRGFVGRSMCYAIFYDSVYYGHIVAGSATLHLPNRNEFLGITGAPGAQLNNVINNIFFNVSPSAEKYPVRNFTSQVVKLFVAQAKKDWENKYGDACIGFETLVEIPRTGALYIRAGWEVVGKTKVSPVKEEQGEDRIVGLGDGFGIPTQTNFDRSWSYVGNASNSNPGG